MKQSCTLYFLPYSKSILWARGSIIMYLACHLLLLTVFCFFSVIAFSQAKTRVTGAANWNTASTWIQLRTGSVAFTNGSATVTGTGTLFTTELQVGDLLMMDATPGTIRGTVASISSNTSLTLTSNATANVSTAAYGRQMVPGSADNVQIGNTVLGSAATITLDVSTTVNSLSLTAQSGISNTLTHQGLFNLNVTTDVTVNQPNGSSGTNSWNINAGTATVSGNVIITGTTANTGRIGRVLLTTGTLNITGNLNYNAFTGSTAVQSVVDLSGGACNLNITGSISLSGAATGTLTPGTASTVTVATGSNIGGSNISFNNVTYSESAAQVTATSNLSITGLLTLNSSVLDMSTFALSGTPTFSAGVTTIRSQNTSATPLPSGFTWPANVLYYSTSAQTVVNGNYTNLNCTGGNRTLGTNIGISEAFTPGGGTYTVTGSTVEFNGSSNQTLPAISYNNITINKASGNVSFAADLNVAGSWINTSNTSLSTGGFTVRFTGSGNISGTNNFSAIILTTTSTGYTLNNNSSCTSLTIEASSSATSLTHSGNSILTVSGNATINQATSTVINSWNINAGSATANGNLNINVTANNNGRVARVVITTGTLTIGGDINFTNAQLAANSTIDMSGGACTLNLAGNLNVSSLGTLTPGTTSTFVYNGTGNQTVTYISAISYNHLKIDKASGTTSLMAHTTIGGDMILQQGPVSATGSNYNLTVNGNWTNNGGTYSGGASNITLAGTTGTISGTTTFPNLLIDGASSTDYTMDNDNSCSSLIFNTGGFNSSLTHSGTAALTVNSAVTINQPTTSSRTNAWNINSGSATVSGLISFSGTNSTTSRVGRIAITSGTLNANGGVTFLTSASATKVIDMSGGAGVLNLKGALTIPANSSTLTAGTAGSIFNYADAVNAQTINFFTAGAYHNLSSNNTGGVGSTLSAAITTANVTGNFRVLSGTCSNGGFAIALNTSKTFEVANVATFKMTGTSGMVTGTTITKTFGATSTCDYAGTGQTVSAETYGHLIFSNSGTKTMPVGTITVQSNFTTSGTISATAAGVMNISGNVTLGSGTSFGGGSSSHTVSGNWTNNGATFTGGTSTVSFDGSVAQTLGGSATTDFNSLTVNNSAGISLSRSKTVAGVLTFTNGLITTSGTNLLILNAGSSTSGAGTGKFVNGPIRKIGNSSFTFPVGKSLVYASISISAPSSSTDAFTAEYMRASASALGSNIAPGLARVSNCEYWQLDRSAGTSSVNVTLSWSNSSPCNASAYISDLATLTVAHFNGTNWDSHDNNGGTTGSVTSGTVTWNTVSNFSPFTIGSTSAMTNPLPLKFGDFKAYEKQSGVQLDWSTYAETNLSHFEIQRSADGSNFITIGQVNARNLNSKSSYSWFDAAPFADYNFYRIKSVDIDAKYNYTEIAKISFVNTITGINIYPNPVPDKRLTFGTGNMESGQYKLAVYDLKGKTIYFQHYNHQGGLISQSIQLPSGINPGIYYLSISGTRNNTMKTFVVH